MRPGPSYVDYHDRDIDAVAQVLSSDEARRTMRALTTGAAKESGLSGA
jgi:hypothetical protein